MRDVVITSAARTPVGRFQGAFANMPAHDLGAIVLREALLRANLCATQVDETIMGQVLSAGQGQNPARQAHLNAGLPKTSSAWGVNQVCGSGLRAVCLAAQQVRLGDCNAVLAGGQENMSLSTHVAHLRSGQKMGHMQFVDTMVHDGLWDAMNDYHMGKTAENVAKRWSISRDEQDSFALRSQNKAEAAQKSGRFEAEIIPVEIISRKKTFLLRKMNISAIGRHLRAYKTYALLLIKRGLLPLEMHLA